MGWLSRFRRRKSGWLPPRGGGYRPGVNTSPEPAGRRPAPPSRGGAGVGQSPFVVRVNTRPAVPRLVLDMDLVSAYEVAARLGQLPVFVTPDQFERLAAGGFVDPGQVYVVNDGMELPPVPIEVKHGE